MIVSPNCFIYYEDRPRYTKVQTLITCVSPISSSVYGFVALGGKDYSVKLGNAQATTVSHTLNSHNLPNTRGH